MGRIKKLDTEGMLGRVNKQKLDDCYWEEVWCVMLADRYCLGHGLRLVRQSRPVRLALPSGKMENHAGHLIAGTMSLY